MSDHGTEDLQDLESVLQKYDKDVADAERVRAAAQTDKSDFFIQFLKVRQTILQSRLTHFKDQIQARGHFATIEISDRVGLLGPDPSITVLIEPKLYNLFSQNDVPACSLRFSCESTTKQVLIQTVLEFDQVKYHRIPLARLTASMVDSRLLQFAKEAFSHG